MRGLCIFQFKTADLGIFFLFFDGLLLFGLTAFESPDAFSDGSTNLWQLPCAEYDEYDKQDDY